MKNLYNNYIRAPLPPGSVNGSVAKAHRSIGIAGALGMGQEKSFAINTVHPNFNTLLSTYPCFVFETQFNTFFVYVTPFIGAIIADTKWGRYKTICVFTVVILCARCLSSVCI
jgi:POT family proton-dependent oligopeptide transporter